MKIALLCGTHLDEFQQKVLAPILEDPAIETAAALIDCRPRPSLKKRFIKNLKRGRGGYMLIMLLKSHAAKKKPSVETKQFLGGYGIDCIETQEPYSMDTTRQLQAFQPEAIVMLGGFGIVREPLLSLAPAGILSYHHGDMRKYRGQPVGFWELYNCEKEMGVTVQRLAAGIDRGTPIVEKSIPIRNDDNVASLRDRALEESTNMMHQALAAIQQPTFRPAVIDCYGPIYTIPNLRQYIALQIKLLTRK